MKILDILKRKNKRFLEVYMDLNNKCNLRCIMCHFSKDTSKIPNKVMSLKLIEKIAKDIFLKTKQLHLSCSAEPLLIKDLSKYLKVTKKYNIPKTTIVTNGLLLDRKTITDIIKNNISELQVSVDASSHDVYKKIRKNDDYKKLVKNLFLLQELKERKNSKTPQLTLLYTVMHSNRSDLPDFIRLAKILRADYVRISHLIPFSGLDMIKESLINNKEETNKIFDKTRLLAKELDVNLEMPPNFNLSKRDNTSPIFNKPNCKIPFTSLYIVSDGRVLPCSWFAMKEYCIGNFKYQTLRDIWNTSKYKRLRQQFKDKELTPYCKNCPSWGQEPIDDYIFKEKERLDVGNISLH